ncbi:MAG: right-handed parallel beta-helix repeat-containing protein [Pirellulales bacterium]|nr:right-handed parallel beta-helix repeat-containing protein [Pirellulales bacterium]
MRFLCLAVGLGIAHWFGLLLSPNAVAQESPAGLVGDGVADDTAAIQRFIDSKGGVLRLPKGIYRITQPIVVDLDQVTNTSITGDGVARVVMDGPGPALRFVGTHQGTASPKTFERRVWNRQHAPMVDGLDIVGHHPDASGIEATGTMQLTLTRVVVRECLHGIRLTGRNRNVTLSECHLYDNHGIGVFLDRLNLHQINIANCHISYNDGGGVVSKLSEIRNLQIGTCDIEGNMGGKDSPPTANIWLDSSESSVGEVAIVGCTIQHSHDAPDSANIRFDGLSTQRSFTDERRHGNLTIADNILSDVQVNVLVQNARGVTITGNTMWKGYRSNLIVDHCRSVVVQGNVFDRNPRYHYGDGAEAKLGVYFVDSSDCTINGNQVSGPVDGEAAMVVRRCSRFNITGCTILDYGRCGLLLDRVSNSRVSDCLIRDDRGGAEGVSIWVQEDDQVDLRDNMVSHIGNETQR